MLRLVSHKRRGAGRDPAAWSDAECPTTKKKVPGGERPAGTKVGVWEAFSLAREFGVVGSRSDLWVIFLDELLRHARREA
jgi:hypothetical protein